MQSQYIDYENTVRVTLWGGTRFMAIMMDTITAMTEYIDSERTVQRLSQFVSSTEIYLLMNCGHVLTDSIDYIIPFPAKAIINSMNQHVSNRLKVC